MRRISLERARRIALAAQGFTDPRPRGRIDVRHFRRVVSRVGLVQLDSVNVLARAHYLPFFSRLGPYPRDALDDWLWESGEMFEYWGHEASLIPLEHRPLFVHRMNGGWHWKSIERLGREHPGYVEWVRAEVERRGPLTAGEVDDEPATAGAWWDWKKAKLALEHLFLIGEVAVATRRNFTRLYDLPGRVHPPGTLEAEGLPTDEARCEMLLLAAQSHGIGTAEDLADYYRIRRPVARPIVERLAAEGRLERVEVPGWRGEAYLHPEAVVPRRVERNALLSPFDPVVWFRPRVARLFGFDYRIEIYVPAEKRVHGYYVLPFLMGDRLVARVDLKADRGGSRLLVRSAHPEEGVDRAAVAEALAEELRSVAAWLGLGEVEVEPVGALAPPLEQALG